jgi:hypothetical protein
MLKRLLTSMSAATMFAAPAIAQDWNVAPSPMDFVATRQVIMNSVVSNIAVGIVPRKGGGSVRGPAAHRASSAAVRLNAGGRVSNAPMPYATSPATQRAAERAYISRNRARNPKLAADIEREFAKVNITQEFSKAARNNGLNPNDTADVMAAFLLAGYEIITGHEPTTAEARGVRRQVAGQLLAVPDIRNPATRTDLSEELKIQFVVLASGYLNIRSPVERTQYRQSVAQFYRRTTGQDLGRLRLTPNGFAS